MNRPATWFCTIAFSCFAFTAVAAEKQPKNSGSKPVQTIEKKGTIFKPSKDTHMKGDTGSASSHKPGNDKSRTKVSVGSYLAEPDGVRAPPHPSGNQKSGDTKSSGKKP